MGLQPWIVELATAGLIVLVLLVDMMGRPSAAPGQAPAASPGLAPAATSAVWWCYLVGCAALLALVLLSRGDLALLGGTYVADGLSWFSKIVVVIGAGLAGALCLNTPGIRRKYQGAYAALLLTASLGMMVLVSSKELITLYVGLETSSLSLYGLAAISKQDDLSLEAGLKYLIVGAVSSGILLYGLSFVFLYAGSTSLDAIRAAVGGGQAVQLPAQGAVQLPAQGGNLLVLVGVLLVLIGVGFKISMVPLHVWTPDVYHGAPTSVTAFISVVSKSAGFVFAIRLLPFAFSGVRGAWEPFLMAAAVLTMTVGNLAAIPQKNVKRLLAYSSISQAGYILVGFLGSPASATSSVLFYLLVYTVTNTAAFAAVLAFSRCTGSDRLEDYAGLARREPALALAFALSLLSLAGIPPLAGFVGKIYLFAAAMERGYLWLVIVATLNSVLSLYYYLLVLKRMYIDEPASLVLGPTGRLRPPVAVRVVLLLTTVAIFWLGILPGGVMKVVSQIGTGL